MSENQLSEKDNIAQKKEMLASLEKALRLAETQVSSIRYFEDSSTVRVYLHSGLSVLVDAERCDANYLLYKTLSKVEPHLDEKIEDRFSLRGCLAPIFKRCRFWED